VSPTVTNEPSTLSPTLSLPARLQRCYPLSRHTPRQSRPTNQRKAYLRSSPISLRKFRHIFLNRPTNHRKAIGGAHQYRFADTSISGTNHAPIKSFVSPKNDTTGGCSRNQTPLPEKLKKVMQPVIYLFLNFPSNLLFTYIFLFMKNTCIA
jgi:hypothetical protein